MTGRSPGTDTRRSPDTDRTIIHVRAGPVGALADWLAERPPAGELVLDLACVAFVRSWELGALAALNRSVRRAGGTLRLANVGPPLAGVLAAAGLDTVLDIGPPHSTAARP